MNRTKSLLAGVGVSLFVAVVTGCANKLPAPSPAAKTELAPTGTLRVAVFTSNPVIGSKDKSTGELRGTAATIGQALGDQAGLPVKLVEYTSIAKLVGDAKAGVWDIATIAREESRRSVVDFAPPHITMDLTLLIAPGSTIMNVADADRPGVTIASARGSVTTTYFERTLKNAVLAQAENEAATFNLFKQGKAQAYAQNRFMLLGLADGMPGARVLEDRFSIAEICIVLPRDRPVALDYVSAFVMQARKSGLIARAIEAEGLRGVSVAQEAQ